MADFVTKLSNESWDTVFDCSDIDSKFNYFLNTYLRIFIQDFLSNESKMKLKEKAG
jgi:hypothetical protein